ncbi:MmgE/PrpD family protein [Azospirillum doebereinerae]
MPSELQHSHILARFIAGTRADELPDAILAKARLHTLDTLACGIAGAASAEAAALLATVLASEPAGGEPVWGTGRRVGARSAALVNGTACHAFELDDTGGCDHSGAVVIPAAVAALGLAGRPVSGREFLLAVTLGYDVARRVLEACGAYRPHNEAGWHSTATCGPFGAAAAASRILGLPAEAVAHALGHAASFSGGLWAFIHDGSQTKRVHAGRAAEGGLLAALLARGGLSGPGAVFEDVWGGFLRTFAPASAVPEALVVGLGERWRLERVAIKPHASCRGTHGAIDALGALIRRHGLRADDIRRVQVRAPAFLVGMCGGREVSGLAAAQMSLPFALATLIVAPEHGVGLDAFRAERRGNPALLAAMERVVLETDPALGGSEEPFVTMEMSDGRILTHRVVDPLGSPANPLPAAEHRAKIRRLAAMTLEEEAVARLIAMVDGLDGEADVRGLAELLRAPVAPGLFV